MEEILSFPLHLFRLGLWRLGQSSLVLRPRGGPVIAVDPLLTDSLPETPPARRRRIPPPFPPERLEAGVVVVTHNHPDHFDAGVLSSASLRAGAMFLGPASVLDRLSRLGVPAARLVRFDAGMVWKEGGVVLESVRAHHTPDVADAIGFVMTIEGGPRTYVTGDTGRDDALKGVGPVDILAVPINGKLGNMGVEGAARLAGELKARWVVPVHYDLFAMNGEDPEAFVFFMEMAGLEERACVLPVMQPLLIGDSGAGVRITRPLVMTWVRGSAAPAVSLPPGYRFRGFRETDAGELGELYRRTMGPGYDATWFRREILGSKVFTPDRVVVVEHGGAVVSAGLAWEDGGHRMPPGHGFMYMVATAPEHHRRGLAKAVAAAIQGWFKAHGRPGVSLVADDWRLRSIRAYTAMGFVPDESDEETRLRWANVRTALEAAESGL